MESVDIILPAYNAETTVGAAIESIANQTVAHLCRLIIVDDGSTDATLEVVQNRLLTLPGLVSRTTVIALGRNEGVAEAYNAGLRAGHSAWITRCDADDLLKPDAIERMLELAHSSRVDIVVGAIEKVNEKKVSILRPKIDRGLNYMPIDTVNFSLCNKLVRRTLLLNAPDRKPLSVMPEINCWDDLSLVARLAAIPWCRMAELKGAPVYRYHRHEGEMSLSRTGRQYQLEQHIECARRLNRWFEDNRLTALFDLFLMRLKFLSKVKLLKGKDAPHRLKEWRETFPETAPYILDMSPDMSLPVRLGFWLLTM